MSHVAVLKRQCRSNSMIGSLYDRMIDRTFFYSISVKFCKRYLIRNYIIHFLNIYLKLLYLQSITCKYEVDPIYFHERGTQNLFQLINIFGRNDSSKITWKARTCCLSTRIVSATTLPFSLHLRYDNVFIDDDSFRGCMGMTAFL